MNTRSMTNKNIVNNSSKQKNEFLNNIKNLVKLNEQTQLPNYESLKIRLQTVIDIAKIIYRNLADVLPEINNTPISGGRLISIMYLKIHEIIYACKNAHIRDYFVNKKQIITIRKIALKAERKCIRCLFTLYNLMPNMNKELIPKYNEIEKLQKKLENMYNLRPRNAIYYHEEDGNYEDPKDNDYIFEEDAVDEEDRQCVNDCLNYTRL